MPEYDAIVVGAGIIGLSTAFHVKKAHPDAKILVVDKFGSAGQASTAKSASAFRCLFSSHTNYVLADSSVEFYRHVQEESDEEDYREVLPILRGSARDNIVYKEYESDELAKKLSLKTEFARDEEASMMHLGSIFRGVFISKAGVVDADCLVRFYEAEFLRLGGEVQYGVEVEDLALEPCEPLGIPNEPYFWQDARITGVKTKKGLIRAKKTILATGAWMAELLDSIGIECFIKPRKRQLFSVPAKDAALHRLLFTKEFNQAGCLPFTVLPRPRAFLRPFPTEGNFWVGYADDFPRPFKLEEDPQAEKNFYQYGIYQVLTKYFPQFKDCRPTSSFAGLYEVNTLDGQPVVFEQNDLIVVGGASGSGIMKADAIGRIASALYKGDEYAVLHGGRKFRVSDLSLRNRRTELEKLVI